MARHVRGNAKPLLQLLAILNGHIIIPVDLPSTGDAFEVFSVKSQGVSSCRLTTIIRQIHIREGSAKAASVGALISNTFWPVIRQCLAQHPGDSKLVARM
jgi:hypothetical protein